jgi:hypothetical protein
MKRTLITLFLTAALVMLPHMTYADTVVFTDTCNSNPAQPLNTSASITVGTSWSTRISISGSPATTITAGTTQCGPAATAANVGLGYTMTPAATTHQYFVDYTWVDLGNAASTDTNGVLINYIDSSNYYACLSTDDASGAVDAYIIKVSGGVGSTLATATNVTVTMTGDTLICRIDYTGANPVISFRDNTDQVILNASTTDSSSPLAYSGTAGVVSGATPARTADDVLAKTAIALDQLRLVESTVVVPTVTTSAASNVTAVSATLNGNITNTGGKNSTVRGLVWGTSSTLQNAFGTTTESGSFGVSSFSDNVSGLIAGTTYYFRAYATNPAGTTYSTITSFVAGTDTTTTRQMLLFGGFTIKFIEGRIILHQQ